MVEADELCDRVAIINEGKVLACDKPSRLKRELQKDSIFRIESSPMNGVTIEDFRSIPGVREFTSEELDGHNALEFILQEESVLGSVINKMTSNNIQIINLEKREPTLEDVFVSLTGKRLEEGAPADE